MIAEPTGVEMNLLPNSRHVAAENELVVVNRKFTNMVYM